LQRDWLPFGVPAPNHVAERSLNWLLPVCYRTRSHVTGRGRTTQASQSGKVQRIQSAWHGATPAETDKTELQNRCSTAELRRHLHAKSKAWQLPYRTIRHYGPRLAQQPDWPDMSVRDRADLLGLLALVRPLSVHLEQRAEVMAQPFCQTVPRPPGRPSDTVMRQLARYHS
jgi:hypothetical protein